MLILISSYVFYGWWDWRFLLLMLFSTLVDFTIGKKIFKEKQERNRKVLLWMSLIVNLGLLGFFKYFNFFQENFVNAFSFFGYKLSGQSLDIILPVGISFYTFQTLSYTIDIYRGKLEPAKSFISFGAFVSFFPQLVAGPIERATKLLPQFYVNRVFDYGNAVNGLRQILWGLFKKVVIADNCAEFANIIFNNSADYSGTTLMLGAVLFAFQIYGDFSGYSDIAIGTARLFGFSLMKNFGTPYFSRDFAEFWRRWHISLSTWFRDYLYIPLGGSRSSKSKVIRNTFIIFLVSGFWHGANWTFIAWGALNAIYFMPKLLLGTNRKNLDVVAEGKKFPSFRELMSMIITFSLASLAWVFFRAENIQHAFQYLKSLLLGLTRKSSYIETFNFIYWDFDISIFILLVLFLWFEWHGREKDYSLARLDGWPRFLRIFIYYFFIVLILLMGGSQQEFIYFQF